MEEFSGDRGTVLVSNAGAIYSGVGVVVVVGSIVAVVLGLLAGSMTVVLIALLLGVVVGGFAIPRALVEWRWDSPEIHIASHPLALGEPTTVQYVRRRAHGTIAGGTGPVQFRLRCNESATYTVGTDTRTDTSTVYDETWTAEGSFAGQSFLAELEIAIPMHAGAPTFDSGNNEVSWELEVNPERAPIPRFSASFTLDVAARLGRFSAGVQDVV